MDVRHFFEVVKDVKADGTKKTLRKTKQKKKGCTGKKYAQRREESERKKKKENRQCLQNS